MKKTKKVVETKSTDIISFSEREKRSKEIQKRIAESYPMVGGNSEDSLWTSLTTASQRDLNTLTQKRMQDIAFYLYDSNPMAKRIIEIMTDFIVGDGFGYTAKDKTVLEVIKKFWEDPQNNLDVQIDDMATEQCLFGELAIPVWVNSANGDVKLGYIDPALIKKITKDRNNPKISKKLTWQKANSQEAKVLDIININKDIKSETYGKLVGDTFFFTINKVTSATRGRSDLLSLADWLDGHDQFLFARLERAFLLNNFIWDIECEGMNENELIEFVKGITIPKPGSIRAHNEKIKWKAETPKLEASDASDEARLFKNQILGGAGFPEHWFAEGSTTTRATALEMGLPTLKKLKSRQRKFKNMLTYIINFVIDQAIIAGTLNENVDRTFKVLVSPIVSRDDKGVAGVINGFVDGLSKAYDNGWIDDKKAKLIFNTFISQVGVDMETDNEIENEEEVIKPKKKLVKKKKEENQDEKA